MFVSFSSRAVILNLINDLPIAACRNLLILPRPTLLFLTTKADIALCCFKPRTHHLVPGCRGDRPHKTNRFWAGKWSRSLSGQDLNEETGHSPTMRTWVNMEGFSPQDWSRVDPWNRRRRWSNGESMALSIFCKFPLPYENPDNPQSIFCSLPILISLHQHPVWSNSHFQC